MTAIPYARRRRTSYENFTAECPWCGGENVFNRVSDLREVTPIAFRTVACLNPECGKQFNINGDTVNPAYQMLLLDCHELLDLKHYMNCVLSVAQAYEVFFSLFLRVELLYRPFGKDTDQDIDHLNQLLQVLADRIKTHAFAKMRALFLWQLAHGVSPSNLASAEVSISNLPTNPNDPSDPEIEALGDPECARLCILVKNSTIGTTRNLVVHKQAYRPTRAEAEEAIEQGTTILFPLGHLLDLKDDVNWYMT